MTVKWLLRLDCYIPIQFLLPFTLIHIPTTDHQPCPLPNTYNTIIYQCIIFSGSPHIVDRRCRRANSGELSRRDCNDEEGFHWGVLPCGPDGGLCLHCTATCTGPGVCSIWRPPLLPQVLETEGKIYIICAMVAVWNMSVLHNKIIDNLIYGCLKAIKPLLILCISFPNYF